MQQSNDCRGRVSASPRTDSQRANAPASDYARSISITCARTSFSPKMSTRTNCAAPKRKLKRWASYCTLRCSFPKAQATVIEAARYWAQDLPVIVSPVTLKPRFNPYTTTTAPPSTVPQGDLPPQVDPRPMSLLGADWTIGSLKYLAE